MAKKKPVPTTTFFSGSESDDDAEMPAATLRPMRHDSTFRGTDGKIIHSTTFVDVLGSPVKRRPEEDLLLPDIPEPEELFTTDDFTPADTFAFDDGHPVDSGARDARETDRPLNIWARDDLEDFLDFCIWDEGRGDYQSQIRCAECRKRGVQEHRCDECFSNALFCTECMVKLHRDHPFHVIRTWTGAAFRQTDLRALGLRIQLGHGRGEICPGTAARSPQEQAAADLESFCIVDSNVIHEVAIDFCTCGAETSRANQLLRARLYPATTIRPRSAATFRVLRKFHKMSFESKCSAYEFYNALARETNNTGTFQPRDRYSAFLRMTREWRHLMMLKRSGRGHMAGGARNIPPGACALLCPACPQPGKNLQAMGAWRSAPREKRFLYALFLAIDANFRMKRKQISSEEADPGLNNGAAFFGEVKAYMEHVKEHWGIEQEKSTCVSHDAVDLPDREARGTASSGIGTVDCARHNMKRPNGVGDLQKGERYINMDYMLWNSLASYDELVTLMISYDIVCQWNKNIWRRLMKYNPVLQSRVGERFYTWLIPKWHLPAHIEACNILYSFNLTPYVGRTDGESPERGWANANPLAASTQEMGPGARRDVLDDHFNDWNHKKIVALGRVMLERIKNAVVKMVETEQELREMEASLPAETLEPWTAAMELWELDPANPNPFNVAEHHESLHAVRGRIATEVSGAVEGDEEGDVRGDVHVSEIISQGMQLEAQQRELASDTAALKTHATEGQKTTMLERGNKLRRKIATWIKSQTDFQPSVATVRAEEDAAIASKSKSQPTAGTAVHAIKLWLPSSQARLAGSAEWLKLSHGRYEFELRQAEAHEALEEMRRLILVRTYHYHAKEEHVSGVAGTTRAKTAIQVLDERVRRQANEYRAAHRALLSLGPRLKETKWSWVLKPLEPDDVRGMPRALFHDEERKKKKKKKNNGAAEPAPPRKEMSWIWRTGLQTITGQAADSEEAAWRATSDALRVEWAKTRARSRRWAEEVDLLEEEMSRITAFLGWRSTWWRSLKEGRPDVVDAAMREGLTAYAERQATIQDELKSTFETNWKDVAHWIKMGREGVAAIRMDVEQRGDSDDDDDEVEDTGGEEDDPIPSDPRYPAAVSALLVESSLLPTA